MDIGWGCGTQSLKEDYRRRLSARIDLISLSGLRDDFQIIVCPNQLNLHIFAKNGQNAQNLNKIFNKCHTTH